MMSKSGQIPSSALYDSLVGFDPDRLDAPVVALTVDVQRVERDIPMHQHKRGQLIVTTRGSVACEMVDGMWPVPPNSALWIPSRRLHKSLVGSDGMICYLYIDSEAANLPATSCFLALSPLVREMIRHIVLAGNLYNPGTPDHHVAETLIEQLGLMEIERVHLPLPSNPRLRKIAREMIAAPSNRRNLAEWASMAALSERSLRRLVQQETGLTFGQWRHHFEVMVAVRDLRQGISVQSVSDSLGYESVSAFSTMFKKIVGISPGRYAVLEKEPGTTSRGTVFRGVPS